MSGDDRGILYRNREETALEFDVWAYLFTMIDCCHFPRVWNGHGDLASTCTTYTVHSQMQ